MAKREALAPRPDGRLFSRVTRRCVVLLKHLHAGRQFDLIEVAREVAETAYPEFLRLEGTKRVPINENRIRDYLSYLHELGVLVQEDRKYSLQAGFSKPSTDDDWAQFLSDTAREHLGKTIKKNPADIPGELERQRKKLHSRARVPTVAAILGEIGVEGARNEELIRWSLYLYTDGVACPLEIRQYPHVAPRS